MSAIVSLMRYCNPCKLLFHKKKNLRKSQILSLSLQLKVMSSVEISVQMVIRNKSEVNISIIFICGLRYNLSPTVLLLEFGDVGYEGDEISVYFFPGLLHFFYLIFLF